MNDMGIGELARRAGVPIDTVRYYERNRLVLPAGRKASGYRQYGEAEIARLRFIRRAKGLGFSLDEIRELLTLSTKRDIAQIRRSAGARGLDLQLEPGAAVAARHVHEARARRGRQRGARSAAAAALTLPPIR